MLRLLLLTAALAWEAVGAIPRTPGVPPSSSIMPPVREAEQEGSAAGRAPPSSTSSRRALRQSGTPAATSGGQGFSLPPSMILSPGRAAPSPSGGGAAAAAPLSPEQALLGSVSSSVDLSRSLSNSVEAAVHLLNGGSPVPTTVPRPPPGPSGSGSGSGSSALGAAQPPPPPAAPPPGPSGPSPAVLGGVLGGLAALIFAALGWAVWRREARRRRAWVAQDDQSALKRMRTSSSGNPGLPSSHSQEIPSQGPPPGGSGGNRAPKGSIQGPESLRAAYRAMLPPGDVQGARRGEGAFYNTGTGWVGALDEEEEEEERQRGQQQGSAAQHSAGGQRSMRSVHSGGAQHSVGSQGSRRTRRTSTEGAVGGSASTERLQEVERMAAAAPALGPAAAASSGPHTPADDLVDGVPRDALIEAEELEDVLKPDGSRFLLGEGTFGEVYKARRGGVQDCAVKKLKNFTESQLQAFKREVGIMMKCSYDRNIVQFYGFCPDPPQLVLEFMEGGDLYSALHEAEDTQHLTWWNKGQCIALDVARGLCYLHQKRVCHADIKSKNVLLARDHGTGKIADVGLARHMLGTHLNTATCPMGTLAYAAPELLLGHRADTKVDIFSFGVLLWELVTHAPVARGELHRPRPGACPPEVARLIGDCVDGRPAARPDAPEVFRRLLAACAPRSH